MPKVTQIRSAGPPAARARRGYFECRYGQLHMHYAMPPGGGFEEGLPLLCVQDFSGSARVFTGFLALAGQERSVYAPDLPGFGESDPPPAAVTLADYAAALADFLETMRLRTLALLGLGLGALLAAELARARESEVKRLVMVSPALPDAARGTAAEAVTAPPQQQWALQAARAWPLRERLSGVTQPLLLLHGRDEVAAPLARLRELRPGMQLGELSQSTGGLLTAPEPLAKAVHAFLQVT